MLDERYEMQKLMFEAYKGRRPNKVDNVKIRVSVFYNYLKEKLTETAAVVTGRKLANNKEYEGAPRVSQQVVEENPRRWIIEECVPACQILWDKNIYTFMCSDGIDNDSWIELEIDCLSEENKAILEQIKEEYVCFPYHPGCLSILVKGKGRKAQEELINMANRFVMQDVPSKHATSTMKEIYMKCGCRKEIDNPDYTPLEEQLANFSIDNWGKEIESPTIIVFDPTKVTKSDDEYLEEVGAIVDEDTGVIYKNQFHYNKHLNYINSFNRGIKK